MAVDDERGHAQREVHALAAVDLEHELALELDRFHRPRKDIDRRQALDLLREGIDTLFEALGVADAGPDHRLALEAQKAAGDLLGARRLLP